MQDDLISRMRPCGSKICSRIGSLRRDCDSTLGPELTSRLMISFADLNMWGTIDRVRDHMCFPPASERE